MKTKLRLFALLIPFFAQAQANESQLELAVTAMTAKPKTYSYSPNRCVLTFELRNRTTAPLSATIAARLNFKDDSGSALIASAAQSFGLKDVIEFSLVAAGTMVTGTESFLGAACEDIESVTITPECPANKLQAHGTCAQPWQSAADSLVPVIFKEAQGGDNEIAAALGPLHGNWRVTREDIDQTPVMRLALIQDEGGQAQGDFTLNAGFCALTGGGITCPLEGETGHISFAHASAGQHTVILAPANDPQSRFILQWDASGAGTMRDQSGSITIPVNTSLFQP